MEQMIVNGGRPLNGIIRMKAAKNSVLPIIACCIMSKEDIVIKNAPAISDIYSMLDIIKSMGGTAEFVGDDIHINCADCKLSLVESDLTSGIRSSIFILGPVLSRFKYAEISFPGGCDIGLRPIDLHIMGLKSLNVSVEEHSGMLKCDGGSLRGGIINLDFPSVGATENIMMASVLGSGKTIIRNAAREPEIIDLQNFINFLGGRVSGAGSDTIIIDGVTRLGGGVYYPVTDRIIASTYLCCCAICGGTIRVDNIKPSSFYAVLEKLSRSGCRIVEGYDYVKLSSDKRLFSIPKIETQPFPGFPTDAQAQFTTLLCLADGYSMVVENLFENRFKYTMQLQKMGADITIKDRVALVKGVKSLHCAKVKAEDLRGGAALIMASCAAEGESIISDIHHVDRGYYKIEDDLAQLGADIKRIKVN